MTSTQKNLLENLLDDRGYAIWMLRKGSSNNRKWERLIIKRTDQIDELIRKAVEKMASIK